MFRKGLCVLRFCQFDTNWRHQGGGALNEELLYLTGLWANLWGFFFDDWHRRAQPTMGGGTSKKVVTECNRKLTEQAMENQTVSSTSAWSLLQFLSWAPALAEIITCKHPQDAFISHGIQSELEKQIKPPGRKSTCL